MFHLDVPTDWTKIFELKFSKYKKEDGSTEFQFSVGWFWIFVILALLFR